MSDFITNGELRMEAERLCDENERLAADNARLRELAQDIYGEYRYLHVRFHRIYVQHEERMRAIEQRMRDLGVGAEHE